MVSAALSTCAISAWAESSEGMTTNSSPRRAACRLCGLSRCSDPPVQRVSGSASKSAATPPEASTVPNSRTWLSRARSTASHWSASATRQNVRRPTASSALASSRHSVRDPLST